MLVRHVASVCGDRRRIYVFASSLAIVCALIASPFVPARAQSVQALPPVTVDAPPPKLVLPDPNVAGAPSSTTTTMSGRPPSAAGERGHERCVDVTIGHDESFGCMNERFKRKVDQINPVLNTPPIDAKSSDLKVGTVNIPAVQQQYGKNFGHSVVPYRPTVVYPSMTGRR